LGGFLIELDKIMKLEKVIEKLEELLRKWGLKRDQWILIANYAFKLQGYESKLRKGHLITMVNREKLPWKVKEGLEVFPPKGSVWEKDFIKWMKQTGFETDLMVYSDREIKKYLNNSILYKLPNKKLVRLITMEGNLISLNHFLTHCREEEAGIDKGVYLLGVIEDLKKASEKKKDKKSVLLADKILKKYAFLKQKKQRKQKIFDGKIQGKGIYGGKVIGRVTLIRRRGKVVNMKKRGILVTKMTSPDFVIMISKIKGVITDEGGRLCHAAILAREFGIPCVIGTEIATKVIKNGDLVELDADLGVVKILQRK